MFSSAPLDTFEITSDTIVEIVPTAGREYVFDIEVERTNNFIANGLVSHNTRWHEDDIVGRITDPNGSYYNEEEAQDWRIIDIPALATSPDDPLGRKVGEALWPERFSAEYLRVQQRSDPRGFQALYQGSPTPMDGAFFKSSHILTYSRLMEMPPKEELRYYAASDHATSVDQARDKTCLIVVGVDRNDHIWVQNDLFWEHASTDRVVEAMILLMQKYKPVFWWAERSQISKAIGPFLRKRMIEKNTFVAIDEVVPIADKQARAQSIQARMAMGRVHFPSWTRWWAQAQDQILKFPAGAHDDFVDALAHVGMGLAKQTPRRYQRPPPVTPTFGTIGWLKADTKTRDREATYAKIKEGW